MLRFRIFDRDQVLYSRDQSGHCEEAEMELRWRSDIGAASANQLFVVSLMHASAHTSHARRSRCD